MVSSSLGHAYLQPEIPFTCPLRTNTGWQNTSPKKVSPASALKVYIRSSINDEITVACVSRNHTSLLEWYRESCQLIPGFQTAAPFVACSIAAALSKEVQRLREVTNC